MFIAFTFQKPTRNSRQSITAAMQQYWPLKIHKNKQKYGKLCGTGIMSPCRLF
jgi:hypothetical protein